MALRDVTCALCGSRDHEQLYADELHGAPPKTTYDFSEETKKTFRIVRCRTCGLVFTNPMPAVSQIYIENVDHTYIESGRQRHKTARRLSEALHALLPRGGKLLDIGCNTGIFLDEASRFFDVEGLELSRWSSRKAGERHVVYSRPLADLELSSDYDCVTMLGVIEHLDEPRVELERIARILRPGGLLVIYTGDVDATLARLLGKRWWWYQGMHLHYFSFRTLSMMLERTGFRVVRRATHTVDFQLFSLAISLRRYRAGNAIGRVLTHPWLRNIMIPLRLSGEMLVFAERR
jgi:2-polyprenyl-3-methyl-5-hydroxy-6-metoxy-1,4-benzoquinol methylase